MVKIRPTEYCTGKFVWTSFVKKETPRLHNPTLIVAVSTSMPQYKALYSQARELGEYMLGKMKFESIATVHSSAFPPEVLVRDEGISTLPACRVYLNKGKRDLLLFTGDSSPMDDQHEFAEMLLQYAKELGVKEVYSIGARWTENPLSPDQDPEPRGFATDLEGVAKLKRGGVKIITDEPAPFFASMVAAMAVEHGMRGYKLSVDHGEPSPHTRGVAVLLGVLSALLGFKIPLTELKVRSQATSDPKKGGEATIYQ